MRHMTHTTSYVAVNIVNKGNDTCGEVALGAHLSEQQQAAPFTQAYRLQPFNDAGTRDEVGICHIRPISNLVNPAAILADHRVADIGKFAVFEYEEVCMHIVSTSYQSFAAPNVVPHAEQS